MAPHSASHVPGPSPIIGGMIQPEQMERLFYLGQIGFGLILVGAFVFLRPKDPGTNFKVREADRKDLPWSKKGHAGQQNDLAQAKMKRAEPLSLPGIRIDGEPHEILGIARGAAPDVVQRAYKDLMKRYHPDLVGRPGSREWNDAQKIAEALNRAKDALLKSPGSGRK